MGVRKSQASLTPAERAAFVAAVKALKANGTYDTFVAQHRAAFLAGVNDPAHGGPAFLPWHREYLRRFERALQAVDPTVSLPYWDWTVDRSTTAPPWTTDFMGGNGSGANEQVTTGPFAFATGQWTLTIRDPGETDPFLKRAFGAMGQLPTTGDVQSANRVVPYDSAPWNRSSSTSTSFRNRLEGVIHNPGHMWVGGSMMAMSSPNDPVFWLHHCNVDRLWAVWQRDHSNEGYLPPSGTPGVVAGHGLDDPMRPWAGQPNPPTPRSVLDHHALGYRYDDDPPETISTQHVVFRATDGRVHELWWSADTGWAEGDLATQTSSALAAAGDPAGYALDGTQHVVYRATDGRVHELWWSADTGWAEGDLAAQTSSAPAAAGDPAGYALGDGTQHVVYRATDDRVHELWWSADTGWAEGDLATQTSSAPAAAGDPAGYALIV